MSDRDLDSLTKLLLSTQENIESRSRSVCFRVQSGSAFANIARHIEREVFEQSFGNSDEIMAAEYGPYDYPGRSTFFISIDREERTAAGAARMIHHSPVGFKTLNDLDKQGSPTSSGPLASRLQTDHGVTKLDTCWDHATLAVRKSFRHGGTYAGLSVQLHRASYVSAIELGIDHVVSVLDIRALKQIRDYLGVPFVPLCGSGVFPYLGSEHSQAVYGFYPEFYQVMAGWRRFKPKRFLARHAYRELVLGANDDALMFGTHREPAA